LARKNDPFFAGSPGQRKLAEWFAGLWKQFNYDRGIHTRRVHYQLVSQPDPCLRPNGKPYENTLESWDYLARASKEARYLGLVLPDAFVDRRNPEVSEFVSYETVQDSPRCVLDEIEWQLPSISTDLSLDNITLPDVYVTGYDYSDSDQPYHLEIWCEKSTMNDVLIPICERYAMNLVTSVGFQSITAVISLLARRVERSGKPARVFYISDFDPAGDWMPTAVARQIEYWIDRYCSQEVKLTPLALTRNQVTDYHLPRIPIKESDKRRAGFEDRYGQGAVELDALEALYPGKLGEIVREAIAPYRDMTLQDRLGEAEEEAQEIAELDWDNVKEEYEPELEAIKQDAEAILSGYRGKLEALAADLEKDLEPIAERLRLVQHMKYTLRRWGLHQIFPRAPPLRPMIQMRRTGCMTAIVSI
jgi:hypothetical protein